MTRASLSVREYESGSAGPLRFFTRAKYRRHRSQTTRSRFGFVPNDKIILGNRLTALPRGGLTVSSPAMNAKTGRRE